MHRLNQMLAALSIFSLLVYSSAPAPMAYAFSENITAASENARTAVKTLEEAQAEASVISLGGGFNPNDFFSESSLSVPDVKNINSNSNGLLSAELKAEAEVFLLETAAFEDFNADLDQAKKDSSNTSSVWGLTRVNAQQAWTLSRGAGMIIAVIDTGLDFKHEDIKNNFYMNEAEMNGIPGVDDDGNGFIDDSRGWDFVNNDNNPTDDNGHGSHVSGIAAADSTNNKGIAGVAPDAKVLAVKVLDASGSGAIENVIKGIKYAADLGAQVINMSLGIFKKYLTNPLLTAFQDAVNYAMNKGSAVITAAGNEGVDSATTAPAGLDNTIAVAAIDSSNKRPSWSNKNPDLSAPGVGILSLKVNGGYVSLSGTSMASPFVAGAAALIRSYFSALYSSLSYTGQQIYQDIYTRLTESAQSLSKKDYDTKFGYGLLDAYKALTMSSGAAVSFVTQAQSFTDAGGAGVFSALQAGFEGSRLPGNPSKNISRRSESGNWYRISAFETQSSKRKKLPVSRAPFQANFRN